jgi:hypothetical protein
VRRVQPGVIRLLDRGLLGDDCARVRLDVRTTPTARDPNAPTRRIATTKLAADRGGPPHATWSAPEARARRCTRYHRPSQRLPHDTGAAIMPGAIQPVARPQHERSNHPECPKKTIRVRAVRITPAFQLRWHMISPAIDSCKRLLGGLTDHAPVTAA